MLAAHRVRLRPLLRFGVGRKAPFGTSRPDPVPADRGGGQTGSTTQRFSPAS